MTTRALTVCVVCHQPAHGTYCHRHGPQRTDDDTTTRQGRGARWQRTAAAVVTDWVAAHGWICPGYRRPAHRVTPGTLTCDHVIPKARGGTDDRANLAVLCRSCNGRKRDRLT